MWLQQNMNSQNSQMELHNISIFCLGWLLPSPFPLYRNTSDSWVIPLSWPKSKQTHVIVSVRNHHSKTHVIACVRKHRLRIGFNFAPGIPIWCNFVASVIHVHFECTWSVLVSLGWWGMLHFFTAVSRHEVTPLRSWSQACHKRGQTWLAQEMVEFIPRMFVAIFWGKKLFFELHWCSRYLCHNYKCNPFPKRDRQLAWVNRSTLYPQFCTNIFLIQMS